MSLTAGALSKVSVGRTTASLLSAAATSGTAPYTYQWYRSTDPAFTPGGGNIIAGATSLTLNDSGLTEGTQYTYKVKVTDNVAATDISAGLLVSTSAALPSQNQFGQSQVLGEVDLPLSPATFSVQIDASETGSLIGGQAVKIVAGTTPGAIPQVAAVTADSDEVFGFINFDVKNKSFVAGDRAEVSQAGNVMWLQAVNNIVQGAQVQLESSQAGGVSALVGSSGARIVGFAYDGASGGQLFRVKLSNPSFSVA